MVAVGVDVGGDGDVRVAHQLFGDIDGDARPLEIGTERVAQAVGGEVGGQGVLGDDAVLDFRAHVQVQGVGKAAPEPLEAVGAAHAPGRGREDQVVRAALGVQEAVPQLLAHGDVRGSWGP